MVFLNSFKQKKRYASLRRTSLLQHYCVILFTTSLPPRIMTVLKVTHITEMAVELDSVNYSKTN